MHNRHPARPLATPTESCFGRVDPARLSVRDGAQRRVHGDKPTKEVALHATFYETRPARTGTVVHLHSTHSVALSMLPDTDPDNMIPLLTAYGIMKLGKVKLLPHFMPGDPAMGGAGGQAQRSRAGPSRTGGRWQGHRGRLLCDGRA
ncbi:class II aldolase/adducin N-terminal domain-containing protein [Aliiruegeria haliotis]|uniref:Class II aldolase/adducin N-terminal domain-containing protein n=1 Tax=Aliiruegeria haliotis TaxID=1280846 RepID=A0A2T0RVW8_9RHOB|nr:class II aldolase/adducin family protein [Aliiruegeria haliotis]PRY25346.1 class II aldolase/adducin N-terminal domain-containing protein [Aliiruegeria haliotis]